jgi:N-acetylmuramoyl-L-alanine amidase
MSMIRQLIISLLCFTISAFFCAWAQPKKQFTIMLDPAGDARHGRIIGDSFERAVIFQFATALQDALKKALPCSVIITRSPGEIVYPLQSANFANRLPIDLYLSLHCYHAPQEKHTIALYHFCRDGDSFASKTSDLAMTSLTKAHWQSADITKKYATTLHTFLQSHYAHQFQIMPLAALPFLSLLGLQAPALGIEINCITPDNATLYVEPLVQSIRSALTS